MEPAWMFIYLAIVLLTVYRVIDMLLERSPAVRRQQNIRYILQEKNWSPGQKLKVIKAIHGQE